MRKKWAVAGALLISLAGCAANPPPSATAAAEVRTASAEVVRDGDGWTADFRFALASPAWIFPHGSVTRRGRQPWRPGSWIVETPGVRLERRGRHDVLFAESGSVPPRVRVRFRPETADLFAEYDPALVFSDGSVALWSGHFFLLPVASPEAAAALPLDLNGVAFAGSGSQVTFRDRRGRVLHTGRRFGSATLVGGKAYVLFGALEPVVSEEIATVIDPALPAWLKRELARSTPAILEQFTDWMGPHGGPRPTLLVSWLGPTPGRQSMGGSTLPTQIGITFEGIGVVAENGEVRGAARTFIAHESAHFWLGNAVSYEFERDSWITEGGADLLAIRAIAAIDRAYDPRPRLQALVNECATLALRPVAGAGERGEIRAYYACGALFGLLVERRSGRPFAAFVRTLVDRNRADRVLTRQEWLDEARAATRDPELIAWIERTLDRGLEDPASSIASMLERTGIAFQRGADGIPLLQ